MSVLDNVLATVIQRYERTREALNKSGVMPAYCRHSTFLVERNVIRGQGHAEEDVFDDVSDQEETEEGGASDSE